MDKCYCDNLRQVLKLTSYEADYWRTSFGVWPVYPYCVEDAVRDCKVYFNERNRRYMLINVILDGDLLYRDSSGREYYLDKGSLFIVPLNCEYSFKTTTLCHYRKLVLEISGDMLLQLQERLGICGCKLLTGGHESVIESVFDLRALMRKGDAADVPKMLGMVWEILTAVSETEYHDDASSCTITAKAKVWLENSLASNGSIKNLACELGICHSLLDRIFLAETGMTPQRYRVEYRYKQAMYYLANTSCSIKEISVRLGYSNQLYFSNDFRKRSGVSPTEFRKTSQSRVQPPTG